MSSCRNRDQLRSAIITWVESTYNHRRRQRVLGKLTPAEFESLTGYNTLAVAA
jgi:transposase InsO family protein